MNWLNSTNAKEIGTLYLIFSVFSGMIGTAFSVLIRLELSSPGVQYLQGDHQLFNVIISAHAFIMIFYMVMPGLVGGFDSLKNFIFHYFLLIKINILYVPGNNVILSNIWLIFLYFIFKINNIFLFIFLFGQILFKLNNILFQNNAIIAIYSFLLKFVFKHTNFVKITVILLKILIFCFLLLSYLYYNSPVIQNDATTRALFKPLPPEHKLLWSEFQNNRVRLSKLDAENDIILPLNFNSSESITILSGEIAYLKLVPSDYIHYKLDDSTLEYEVGIHKDKFYCYKLKKINGREFLFNEANVLRYERLSNNRLVTVSKTILVSNSLKPNYPYYYKLIK